MRKEEFTTGAAVIYNDEGGCYILGELTKYDSPRRPKMETWDWYIIDAYKITADSEWTFNRTTVSWGDDGSYLRLHPDPDALWADYFAARLLCKGA